VLDHFGDGSVITGNRLHCYWL